MARYKRGKIDFDTLGEDETALLSHFGDTEAFNILWAASIPQVERIAGLFVRRYPWISHEDLVQTVLCDFPKLVSRYDPEKARTRNITWNKYLYFAFYRAAQDALRREDPLGVKIPQKARYPSWRRFSELTSSQALLEAIVIDGLDKIDRGDDAILDPENSPDENSYEGLRRQTASPEYHDHVYHGKLPWVRADLP